MKVFIVGGDNSIGRMYTNRGHTLVDNLTDANLIQFTGGADVDPELYDSDVHPTTHYDADRDTKEIAYFLEALELGKDIVGICRGGQFLNVVNGGSLYQDVDGHAIAGTHTVIDMETLEEYDCTSTHHQQMIKGADGILVATGDRQSTYRKYMVEGEEEDGSMQEDDVEVVYYLNTYSLCVQFHPEYVSKDHECQEYFFSLLEEFFSFKE